MPRVVDVGRLRHEHRPASFLIPMLSNILRWLRPAMRVG